MSSIHPPVHPALNRFHGIGGAFFPEHHPRETWAAYVDKIAEWCAGPRTASGGVWGGVAQSWWKTSSMEAHHSPLARSGSGTWQGTQCVHHFFVVGSAAIFAASPAKSLPVYSK